MLIFEPPQAVVLLPRLQIQNANAISSPLTWGFPSPVSFLGFAHALERRVQDMGEALRFSRIAMVCHKFSPQIFRPPGRYVHAFRLTRNPVDKEGNTSAIVEEGRAHIEVSLVLTVAGNACPQGEAVRQSLAHHILDIAEGMRIAGGSVLPNPDRSRHLPRWLGWDPARPDSGDKVLRMLRRRLSSGSVLVGRDALFAEHLAHLRAQAQTQQATPLDALLDLCRLHIAPDLGLESAGREAGIEDESPPDAAPMADLPAGPRSATTTSAVQWTARRARRGWLVPLPVGYAAISPPYDGGQVKGTRDADTPFRFVESALSLGEWVNAHRITSLEELFWHADAQPEAGLYCARNTYTPAD